MYIPINQHKTQIFLYNIPKKIEKKNNPPQNPMQHYQKSIHHITTLILNNQYNRAHSILTHLIQQGLTNSQIYVMLSYCTKMMYGISAGINVLRSCCNTSPIVQMALGQYYRELGQDKKCLGVLSNIIKSSTEREQNTPQNTTILSTITHSLEISLQPDKKPPIYTTKHPQIDIEAINQLNNIIEKYKLEQQSLTTTLSKLKQLLIARKLQGKLKDIVSRYVRYVEFQIKGTC